MTEQMSTPTWRTASAITLSAALAGFLAPVAAQATPAPARPTQTVAATTNQQPSWTSATMPAISASLFDAIQLDPHTTWAYGIELDPSVGPLLLAKDDRDRRGWTQLPTDALGENNRINAVSAVSANDAWLVGDLGPSGIVTAYWDGASMRTFNGPVPAKAIDGGLLAVSAHASNDVWATGWAEILDSIEPDPNPSKPGGTIQVTHNEALLEHWDGRSWQIVPVPDSREMVLQSVVAFTRSDVWAAGYTGEDQPALLHFDGRTWSPAPALPYAGLYGEVQSLAANGPNDIWAVGRDVVDDDDWGHALVAHWDGHHWRQVSTPATAGQLWNVATVPGGIAVTGSTVDQLDGYAMRFTDNHWQSLGIPVGGATHVLATGLLYSCGTLTVVGYTSADESSLLQPLVLTGQL